MEGGGNMAQLKIELNHVQSKIFARAIYADITAYIEAHQEEYQKFLKESESEKTYEVESTY